MLLFFDTETTGLPDWRAPSVSKTQPHIVQLAALLTDNKGNAQAGMNDIIRPDGWEIPDEVVELHGISTERAMDEGIPIVQALTAFVGMLGHSPMGVAHNVSFDKRMLRIQMLRNRGLFGVWAKAWKTWPTFCTAIHSKHLCKLAPTDKMVAVGRRGYKVPKLAEALKLLTGEEIGDQAHDAAHDVKACRQVFFAINKISPVEIPVKYPLPIDQSDKYLNASKGGDADVPFDDTVPLFEDVSKKGEDHG